MFDAVFVFRSLSIWLFGINRMPCIRLSLSLVYLVFIFMCFVSVFILRFLFVSFPLSLSLSLLFSVKFFFNVLMIGFVYFFY